MLRQRKHKRRAEQTAGDETGGVKVKLAEPVKETKTGKPLKMLRRIMNHPDFAYQCMVIFLSISQGNGSMERRIDTMNSSIETVRNITGVLNKATQSLKAAAEAPREIRRLVKPDGG
jgi:hypothetical protein